MTRTPTLDAMETLKDYPNLEAIVAGRVAGPVGEWPALRAELVRLCGFFSDGATLRDEMRIALEAATKRSQEQGGEIGDLRHKLVMAQAEARELKNRLDKEERDAGALASAVGTYIDGGCNDDEGLQAAISKWSQYEEEAPK